MDVVGECDVSGSVRILTVHESDNFDGIQVWKVGHHMSLYCGHVQLRGRFWPFDRIRNRATRLAIVMSHEERHFKFMNRT